MIANLKDKLFIRTPTITCHVDDSTLSGGIQLHWLLILSITLFFTLTVISFYYRIDKHDPEPIKNLIIGFLLGCLSPFISVPLYFLFIFILSSYDDNTVVFIEFVLLAPFLEELVKAYIILQLVEKFGIDGPLDGLIYGASVGAGFAAIENMIYAINGLNELGSLFAIQLTILRGGITFIGHPLYSGLFGWGIGAYKLKLSHNLYNKLHYSIGLHALWNFTTITIRVFNINQFILTLLLMSVVFLTLFVALNHIKFAIQIDDQLYQKGYFDESRNLRIRTWDD